MLNHVTIIAAIRDGRCITQERVRVYPRIILAIFLAGLAWLVLSPIGPRWNGSDFAGFWVPANLAAVGHATAIYDQQLFATLQQTVSGQSKMYLPWIYPPTFLLLILPLGVLPYVTALIAWMTIGLAVYTVVLRQIVHRAGLVVALAFPGVMVCVYNGHGEILLAGLFGGAMLLLDRRPCIAGLLIGICSIKPHLFLLVPVALLAGGHWRAILSATVLTLLGAAISAVVFGTEVWRDFFLAISNLGDGALQHGTSFVTVLAKQQSTFAFGLRFGAPVAAAGLQVATIVLAGCAVAITWTKDRPLEDRAIVLCCGTLLASPYLFDYDLVLLAAPIALLASAGVTKGFKPWQKSLLSALWAAPALARTCSYYGEFPVTVILLGLSIAIFVVPGGRLKRDMRSTAFDRPRTPVATVAG